MAFSFCPDLITRERTRSIWLQICWLRYRPESHHGGNHWLENLISLCLVGLFLIQFSNYIYKYAIKNLEKELKLQILNDGGHEERTASYHILILDRLTELGCLFIIYERVVPKWLKQKVYEMLGWLKNIRLINDNYQFLMIAFKIHVGTLMMYIFLQRAFYKRIL